MERSYQKFGVKFLTFQTELGLRSFLSQSNIKESDLIISKKLSEIEESDAIKIVERVSIYTNQYAAYDKSYSKWYGTAVESLNSLLKHQIGYPNIYILAWKS